MMTGKHGKGRDGTVGRTAFAIGAWLMFTAAGAEPQPIFQGLDVGLTRNPVAVDEGDGERHLTYELHLTSFAGIPMQLTAVEVLDGPSDRAVATIESAALGAAIGGPAPGDGPRSRVEPGERVIVYLDIGIRGPVPRELRHRLRLRAADGSGAERLLLTEPAPVDAGPLPVLGAPLRAGPWVAVYDRGIERGHRRVVYAVHGRARIPGRHAIDWMRAPGTGSGAGAEVLAVADGVIEAARDSFPDPAPGGKPQDRTLADAAGNYIALRLGGGRFAVYEHLAAGLLVKPGDRVRKGQVIARVGATGQASRPHLHFHVGDSPEPAAAEGLPYRLETFGIEGRFASLQAFDDGGPADRHPGRQLRNAFPPSNAIIAFPGR